MKTEVEPPEGNELEIVCFIVGIGLSPTSIEYALDFYKSGDYGLIAAGILAAASASYGTYLSYKELFHGAVKKE